MTRSEAAASSPLALPGFGVLLQRELLEAARSKRIVIFLGIMTFTVALVPVIGYLRIEHIGDSARHVVPYSNMRGMLLGWTSLVGFLGALMVIASTVDAVSSERSSGITAWIVTKPVSRLSYLMSKAVAHTVTSIVTLVAFPTLVFGILMLVLFQGVPIAALVSATLILCIEMGFLSFFTIAIGVPLRTVTPIALTALAFWFLPTLVPAISSLRWTFRVLPSYLPIAALSAAAEEASSPTYTIPLASILLAAGVFVAAVALFERQEL